GLGLVAVEWVLRRRVTFAGLLAMAFVWSPMMLIGLLNFAGGQALALWAFALWVAMRDCRWRASVFVPIGVVVWLFHLSAWAILGVLVFGYEWEMRRDWRAFLAPWPLLGPVWIMAMLPGTSGAFSYGGNWWLYKQAIWLKAMRDTAYALDYLGLVAVMLAIGGALFFRRIDGRLGWAGLILLALTIAVPRHISGGDYADYRLVTAGLMICCLAIDWGDAPRWAVGLAPALYLARLVVTTLSWQADSAQTGEVLAALDHVPRGARIASAVYVPREAWRLDHFEHIGAYAVFRRDALTNANFAVANVHMLHLKPEIPGFVDPSQRIIEAASQPLDLAGFAPAEHADWLWYVGDRQPDTLPAGAMVWRSDHGLLLRLSHAGDAGALAKSGGAH
ncbi:MAG TPA: hypothetical protein VN222_05420, partial [Novosphingobium sp.]|nr:hypothetical protein [Novosphingobium sp.]